MLKPYAARIWVASSLTVLVVCLAWFALYGWFALEAIQENRYANYAEARESQRRGWLPTLLPQSATEIHEWHEIDTNLCVGSFRFDPRERASIEVTLRSGRSRMIRIDRDPSFASPLPRDPGETQLTGAGFDLYSESGFDLAINWTAGMAYFWNSSS